MSVMIVSPCNYAHVSRLLLSDGTGDRRFGDNCDEFSYIIGIFGAEGEISKIDLFLNFGFDELSTIYKVSIQIFILKIYTTII